MTDTYATGCVIGAVVTVDLACFAAYIYWPTSPPKVGRHSKAGIEARYFEPREATDRFRAHCPSENRLTDHARLRLGGVVCTTPGCRNPYGSGWGR